MLLFFNELEVKTKNNWKINRKFLIGFTLLTRLTIAL